MASDVFLSVGQTWTEEQETFVGALESLLEANGLTPRTVGRTDFSASAPLKRIVELMETTSGTVVCAFERTRSEVMVEKFGSDFERRARDIKLPIVWNQIEAAMTYTRKQPLLVVVERGLKIEGLLAESYDWYVLTVDVSGTSLQSKEAHAVVSDWSQKVRLYNASGARTDQSSLDATKLTVKDLVTRLPVGQAWAVLAALLVLVAAVATIAYQAGQASVG